MYTEMLQICRNPYVRLYSRSSLDIVDADCVHSFLGDTWDGRGEVDFVYLRNGRYRWMKRSWKNMLGSIVSREQV